ncbi:MAG: hypothetical protein ACOC1F_02480 [Myxococcota bacterium]
MTRRSSWLRVVVFCLLPALLFAGGCDGCGEEKVKPQPAAELPAVPAPAHHVADVFIPQPAEAYKNIRTRVGGALTLLPASFPSMVVTVLGLSAQLLEQVDGKSPAYGVVTDDGARVAVVTGIHVRNGARTLELLTEGADAKYDAKPVKDGLVLLEPRPVLKSRAATLGVAGNYLLVAQKKEDIEAAGPYVVGTLPKRSAHEGEIVLVAPGSALEGPIVKRIRDTWSSFREEREKDDQKMRKSKGRAPDFGEPAAALADVEGKVETITTLLSDLESAKLRLDTDATGIHAMLTLDPSKDGKAAKEFASMKTGDLAPLLGMPRDTVIGVLMREEGAVRVKDAKDQAAGLARLLGDRLGDKEKALVEEALSTWAKGRGDWMAAALRWSRDQQEAYVRGSVQDPKQLDEGIRMLLGLTEVDAFREPLEHRLGEMDFGKPKKAGAGAFVHVERKKKVPEGKEPKTSAFDIAWHIDEENKTFRMRAGEGGEDWLTAKEPAKQPTLGEHPTTSKVFSGIGDNASFVLFVDPQLFLASMAPKRAKVREKSAPFVFAYGGAQEQGWLKLVLRTPRPASSSNSSAARPAGSPPHRASTTHVYRPQTCRGRADALA